MGRGLFRLFIISAALCSLQKPAAALEPKEILVLANRNAARSVGLAKYYMKKRGIPERNLLKLRVTDKETCSRSHYEKKVAAPVRRYINKLNKKGDIRCLVTMYGLPLKVQPPRLTFREKEEIRNQKNQGQGLKRQLDMGASLDSEIALVLEKNYPIPGWVPNPYYLGFRTRELSVERENVLMVSRLDGPSEEIVRRVIDDSLKTEEKGLRGIAYFDARWPEPGEKALSGYSLYDKSLYLAARRVEKSGRMRVVVENTEKLFSPGQCPEAALYAGWYSLAKYVDAFFWQPGSIGYHIASGECTTLKKKNSRIWCKMMLEKGIAATVGPVAEPYVSAFPVPEIFFGFLVDGYLSLAECYIISTPYLSWKMVLVGDPLYKPFKNMQ